MNKDFYREVVNHAPFGYAHHEIMLDDQGKPIDYRYLDVNDAFRELTGIKAKNIVGKTVTELIPGIRSEKLDWVEYYGKIALGGGGEAFEQYAEQLGRWYQVQVFSTERLFFTTIFTDITPEKHKKDYRKRLQMAQAFTDSGTWEYDIKTGILYWSAECEKIFGLDEGVFEGTFRGFLNRVHPDDRDYVVEVNKPITELKEGVPLQYEHRIIRADGAVRWVREAAGVMRDETGKPEKIIGFVYDITKQKDNESTLEQEEKLRQIVSNIDGAFWLMSSDKQEMLYMSPNFENIIGKPAERIVGNMEAFMELVHEEDREEGIKAYTEFLKTGNYAMDYRIRRPDGNIMWVHSKAFPVKNEQGNIIRYAGIIQDITGKKTAETESKERTERLNAVLSAIPDMFLVIDKDGFFMDVIATDPSKLLVPPDQVIGKSLHDMFSPDEAKRQLGFYQKCLQEKKLTVFEYQVALDNQIMSFEARLNPLNDGTILAIVRDITEAKHLQESYKEELDFRQFLFHSNKDGMVTLNNDHKVVDANESFCTMLGYSNDEIKSMHTWDFDAIATEKDIKTGFDISLKLDTTFESRHRRKDGSVYDVEVSARSFHWKGERLVICTCRDITGRKRMEQETMEAKGIAEANQRRFEEITEYAGEFVWEVDKNGIFTYANPAVERMLGYKPEELVGKVNSYDLFPENIRTRIQKEVARLTAAKAPISELESVMISKSGQRVYVITNGIPVLDADGELIGYRGSDRDVTDRRRAEIALKESEEKYRRLAYNLQAGIVVHNADTSITFSNKEASSLLGLTADQLSGRKAEHPDWYFLNKQGEKVKTDEYPVNVVFSTNKPLMNKTFGIAHPEKNIVKWVLVNAFPEYDQQGQIDQVVVTFINITKIKEAEEKFRIVANNTYNWEFWESPEGKFLYHSPACREITGYSPEELYEDINMFLDLIHPDDRQGYLDHHKDAKQDHKKRTHYFRIITPGGKTKHIEHLCRPVFDDHNNFLGVRGTNVDITERVEAKEKLVKAMEKAEEASRLKTAFIDNISHEIRTPLNGIIGFGQLIAQPNLTSDERMSYYKTLQKSTDRLIQTVTDFMDISKIASGNMAVTTKHFSLKSVLNEQFERVSGLCASKGIDVGLDIPQEISNLTLRSDDELLRKALGHLLDNAVKFSDKGTISLGYRVKDQSAEVFVKDQGKGIDKEQLEKIFEPFVQEDLRMTRGYEGSGLGLAIIQGIAKLLGGKAWARSEKGKGSAFYLSIPYDEKQGPDAQALSGSYAKQTVDNPLILVAEDDDSNYALMEIILEQQGYDILHAKNGKEAVDLCRSNPDIHLVLMDIKMPVMNGLDATRHIREIRSDLPVVAVTAYLRSGDEHLIRDAGCEECCQKPFTKEKLLTLVGKYIAKTAR